MTSGKSILFLIKRTGFPFLIALILAYTSGCNPQVNIYKNNGKYYSIYGFLNASADTQYIRIEELRDSMPRSAPPHLDTIVKLTDLISKKTVTMHDSLFHFEEGDTHNYYTTMKIMPLHTYRLKVDGPNGAESSAQVQVPDTFPKPTVIEPIGPSANLGCDWYTRGRAKIEITGIKRLVAVNAIYYTFSLSNSGIKDYGHWNFEHLRDTTRTETGQIIATIQYDGDLCHTNGNSVIKVDVVTAAGNPDWPNFLGLNLETQVLPSVNTNVKGGIGLLGGVVTDTVTVYGKN